MNKDILQGTGVLYHVTPTVNIDSIDAEGINPLYAKGKMSASWYVRQSEITWAICHVSLRHNIPVNEITVCATLIDWSDMKRTARMGRYYTAKVYHPESFSPASFFVES